MGLIDRNTILNRYQEICNGTACMDCPFNKDGCAVEKLILESAVVDAEPIRHGKWIGKPIGGYSDVKCNACGNVFLENNGKWKYCPNCGAKMDEVNND